jgi:hypothetical protein
MAHYVACPQKKIISRIFKISGALIVKRKDPNPEPDTYLCLTDPDPGGLKNMRIRIWSLSTASRIAYPDTVNFAGSGSLVVGETGSGCSKLHWKRELTKSNQINTFIFQTSPYKNIYNVHN